MRYGFIGPYIIPAEQVPLVRDIQIEVARFYGIPMMDMRSDRRTWDVARPRQVAMYLSKKLTLQSLPQIAKRFRRDHTTVIHAVRAIEQRRLLDSILDRDIRALATRLT